MSNIGPKQNKLSPRNGKIAVNSLIIKPKRAAILVNWIQKKGYKESIPIDSKYKLYNIYRGSRDGYDINTIRNKCDGLGACILVIKTKEKSIIGGYNPLGWKSISIQHKIGKPSYWAETSESFIYSFSENDWDNLKISRVANKNKAIYESTYQHLPLNFGNSDLVININEDDHKSGTCKLNYYESEILDTNNFTIEEMEIFRLCIKDE
ncbi:9931_t:CDS:1 [Funneliformis geosporum]|uniref:17853_t:CDS:1 n=1 Tax=Funneliformis geosporum TaxID=1117311 RepID=A0A9W4WR70_9GLOM|nr:17853_t:CDS:1 [Funneliformis geosporum]CAI2178584.1 9931_t:CDS:1 [Funneliformis geosporum]